MVNRIQRGSDCNVYIAKITTSLEVCNEIENWNGSLEN